MSETIAYLVQAMRSDQPTLCIIDGDGKFHRIPICMQTVARLNAESADIIRVALGGVDFKKAGEELAALWSRQNVPPSNP